MPTAATLVRVFVASPSDVLAERDVVRDVVDSLNLQWRRSGTLRIELLAWETDTYPSAGTDAQTTINEQIGDDYDIFIGIMATKFGSPTSRAGSGTEEEFNRAHRRHGDNPRSIKVMFYFKDAPVRRSEIDTAQLEKVNTFEKAMREAGCLTGKFDSTEDFRRQLQIHLPVAANDLLREQSAAVAVAQPRQVAPLATADEGEPGFLDLIVEGIQKMEEVTSVTHEMTFSLSEFTERIQARTKEIESVARTLDPVAQKRVVDRAASDFESFAARLESQIPVFKSAYEQAMTSYGGAAALLPDFGEVDEESIDEALNAIDQLCSSVSSACQPTMAFRDTIKSTPRASTKYNRAKRRVVNALDVQIREFENAVQIGRQVHELMQRV